MNRRTARLALLLVFVLACLVLVLPNLNQYLMTTGWGVGIDYGRRYIISNGHLPEQTLDGTWQAKIKNYGSEDFLSKILFSEICIMSGNTDSPGDLRFLNTIAFAKMFMMPLFAFYALRSFRNRRGKENPIETIMIVSLAMLPIAGSLPSSPGSGGAGNNVTVALFMLILILLLNDSKGLRKPVLLALLSVYYLFWHTWSYYMLIVVVCVFVGTSLKSIRNVRWIASIAIVIYLLEAYLANFHQMLSSPLGEVRFFFETGEAQARFDPKYFGYATGRSFYSVMQIVNSILLLLLVAVALRIATRSNKLGESRLRKQVLVMIILSIPIMWLGLLGQGGTLNFIGRAIEPVIPIAILCACFVLAFEVMDKKTRRVIIAIGLTIVAISASSYVLNPYRVDFATQQEDSALQYVGTHTDNDQPFFSDFRLGTPLIYYEKKYIYTIDRTTQSQGLYENLLSVFYERTHASEAIDQAVPSSSYVVITSKYQTIWGVEDPAKILKPAIMGFQENFDEDPGFLKLLCNGDAELYLRCQ